MICDRCNLNMPLIQNTVYVCDKCNKIIPLNDSIYIPDINESPVNNGPGTELSSLLSKFGIYENISCACKSRSNYMDRMESKETGWCEKNIDTIIGWLEEEARNRNLPFSKIAAKVLVKWAIYRAKKKAKIK